MDWLPSVLLLIVGSARRGSQLLAVWEIAYTSRTLFAWHDPLPLELGISSLASVVLAVHRKNVHSYPYVDLPPRAEDFFFGFCCANRTSEESLSFLSFC